MAARKTSPMWRSSRSVPVSELGLYVNGQLVRGENGAAGEIGYLPIGGDPLRSGGPFPQGCLEYSWLAPRVSCVDTGRPAAPRSTRSDKVLSKHAGREMRWRRGVIDETAAR